MVSVFDKKILLKVDDKIRLIVNDEREAQKLDKTNCVWLHDYMRKFKVGTVFTVRDAPGNVLENFHISLNGEAVSYYWSPCWFEKVNEFKGNI